MAKIQQVSFTGGEISPSLAARVDLARYQTSLKLCKNWFVRPTGGVSNRPGSQYIDSLDEFIPIPFVFSADQAYVLCFGDFTIDVYAQGSAVGSTIVSPYALADVERLRFTQSADVLTLTHPDYPQHEFRRLSATTFEIAEIGDFENGPFLDLNTDETSTVTASAATGSVTLTAVDGIFNANQIGGFFKLVEQDLSEIPPWEPSKLIAASGANPNGELRRSDGKVYQCVTNETASGDGTYTGTVRPTHDEGTEADGDGQPVPNLAQRAGVDWLYLHSGFGILRITAVASATSATATVLSRLPASVVSPNTTYLWASGAWNDEQGYPSVCTYYQDRLVFAATPGQPQTEWASRVGKYHDFGISSPLADDDAITQTLNARQINAIRELVPLDQLIALTASSSWASPRRGEVWSPSTIGFDPQAYNGAAAVRSVLIGDTAIYVDRFATKTRDMRYQFEIDKFSGNELTVMARHLFSRTKTITDIDYASEPHGILWHIRSDGYLIGLTYLREHDVIGWHQHTTQGLWKRVCVIPENGKDTVYLRAERVINGIRRQYLERLADREIEAIEDGVFMDAALSFDGRVTDGTLAVLNATDWSAGSTLSCSLDGSTTFAGNLPDELTLTVDGETLRVEVIALLNSSAVSCRCDRDVPMSFQGVSTATWSKLYDTFSGLEHLEGMDVAVLADGSVVDDMHVTAGAITLPNPAAVVHVGLAILEADLESLNINIFSGESVRARAKNIPEVEIVFENTRGVSVGPDAEHLEEIPERNEGDTDGPGALLNDVQTFIIPNTWNENGRVYIRQTYPLPATILSMTPKIVFGS